MALFRRLLLVHFFLFPGMVFAQDNYKLQENFTSGYLHQVSCRVDISGHLVLSPPESGKEGAEKKKLAVKGSSAIDYDERILVEKNARVDRTVRQYRRLVFERTVGDQVQKNSLRKEIPLLVIVRHNQFEVPFSPLGPLTWGEIDLVRTDVFTPALVGLLPTSPVKPGDRWQADGTALQELTDMDRIEKGELTCKFDMVTTLLKRRLVRVNFQGEVHGIGEDGPCRHELEGYYFFDLESNHLSYLFMRGTQVMLDKANKEVGKIEGTFVLTRQPMNESRELGDEALRGLVLTPNEDNTLLLYDNPELGVRFLYPRRWRVAGVSGRQIALDEKAGSGLLITLDPLAKVPSGPQFQQESNQWLNQNKAPIFRTDPLRQEQGPPNPIEHFGFDTEINKQRVLMDYYVLRQAEGGATLACRLLPNDQAGLQREVGRLVRSLEIRAPAVPR